jgi:hypothetical protein
MVSTPEIKKNINAKKFFPESRHIITYAFSIGANHYFKFDDHLNIPYERALSCLVFYREVEMNIDHMFLKAHIDAIDNILLSKQIDIFKIKNLNDQLKTRLTLPKDPELMYKLASVVYFDQHESPEVYEWEYGKKKIDFWKKNSSLKDFFLQKPLQELIPYLRYAGENLETFSRMMQDVNDHHWGKVLGNLSEKQKTILNDKRGSSPVVTPQN